MPIVLPPAVAHDERLNASDWRVFACVSLHDQARRLPTSAREGFYAYQRDLANAVGCSREQANRSLNKLRDLGYIKYDGRLGKKDGLRYRLEDSPLPNLEKQAYEEKHVTERLRKEDVRKWAMATYAQTQADGFFTASWYANMPGARWLLNSARDIGLVCPVVVDQGRRNRWVSDDPPSNDQLEELFKAALGTGGANPDIAKRLDAIDEKLDRLLELWA